MWMGSKTAVRNGFDVRAGTRAPNGIVGGPGLAGYTHVRSPALTGAAAASGGLPVPQSSM